MTNGSALLKITQKVHSWYQGEFVGHDNPPGSSIVFIGGYYRRHWSASVARVLVEFWLRHWKWIIGVLIAIVGLVLSASK